MKKEEYANLIKEIGECESIEVARTKLVDLQKEIFKDSDEHASIITERDQFKTDNENLRATNMKLFLQVGSKGEPKKPTEEEKELKYDDLFNEKGELK